MPRLLQPAYGAYSALAALVTVLLFALPVLLAPTLAMRRAFGRACMKVAMTACLIPVRVRGLQHLPEGTCIVVSNHASYLDGPLLTAALPSRFTFVVQGGAATWPFFGRVIRRMGVTFVDRTVARARAQQTRQLIRRIEAGQCLTIFPEGTFKGPPGLLPFRKGAFLMAAHAGVPVVPAVIRGTRTMFGEGFRYLRWNPVDIEFFAPIKAAGDHRHAAPALAEAVRKVVLEHCGEPDAASLSRDAGEGQGEGNDD